MISNDWNEVLKEEFQKDYFKRIFAFLENEYNTKKIFPPKDKIFSALEFSSFSETKVVILGQDPYHGEGQAHGLSFSVPHGIEVPPSLKNMFKELQSDVGFAIPNHGYLIDWAKQGVLLLNATLTVEEAKANSHLKIGWTTFTDKIIEKLNERKDPVIFVLWGNNARDKLSLITSPQHFVLCAAHPSPLSASRGFFGCRHFSKINTILKSLDKQPINWKLEMI